jgi:ATP-dependent helicase YprA (DUF1998 family)
LEEKDVMIKAETGSGKTLTYLLPIIHELLDKKIHRNDGTYGTFATCLFGDLVVSRKLIIWLAERDLRDLRDLMDFWCFLMFFGVFWCFLVFFGSWCGLLWEMNLSDFR